MQRVKIFRGFSIRLSSSSISVSTTTWAHPANPSPCAEKGMANSSARDAGLILRRVEDRHPDGAGDAVLLCAAVETDHSLRRNDPGDVRAVIRDDGLRSLLLRQRLRLSQFVCIQTLLF